MMVAGPRLPVQRAPSRQVDAGQLQGAVVHNVWAHVNLDGATDLPYVGGAVVWAVWCGVVSCRVVGGFEHTVGCSAAGGW